MRVGSAELQNQAARVVLEFMKVCLYVRSFDRQFVEVLWQAGRERGGYCSVASENPRVFGQDI